MDGAYVKAWGNALFGGVPADYTVVDLETSGREPKEDKILQIGWCVVRGGRPVANASVILNWPRRLTGVEAELFKARVENTASFMRSRGLNYPWTMQVLSDQGVDPLRALADLYMRVVSTPSPVLIAGHNVKRFDMPCLETHFAAHLRLNWTPNPRLVLDTGALYKGAKVGELPRPGETPGAFTDRIMGMVCSVKWSLDREVVPALRIAERYGLDMSKAHDAAFDCYLTHLVVEEARRLAAAA